MSGAGPFSVDNWADVTRMEAYYDPGHVAFNPDGSMQCGLAEVANENAAQWTQAGSFSGYEGSPDRAPCWKSGLAGSVDAQLNGAQKLWDLIKSHQSVTQDPSYSSGWMIVPENESNPPSRDYTQTFTKDASAYQYDGQI